MLFYGLMPIAARVASQFQGEQEAKYKASPADVGLEPLVKVKVMTKVLDITVFATVIGMRASANICVCVCKYYCA